MKTLSTLILSLFTLGIWAQPTITSDWYPQFGDMVEDVVGQVDTTLSPGPSGAGVSWDFSDVPRDMNVPIANFTYGDPQQSNFFSSFANSNLALYPTGQNPADAPVTFYNINNNTWSLLGNALPNTRIFYTNPQLLSVTPFTYGDSFQDNYASTTDIMGLVTNTEGTVMAMADGYGDLQTPNATYSNVLRVRTDQTRRDSLSQAPGLSNITELQITSYTWFDNNLETAVANMVITTGRSITNITGLPPNVVSLPQTRSFNWTNIGGTSSALDEGLKNSEIRMTLLPNPAQDVVNVKIDTPVASKFEMGLSDILGRQLYGRHEILPAGTNSIPMSLDHLKPGHYLVKIDSAQGSITRKLLKR